MSTDAPTEVTLLRCRMLLRPDDPDVFSLYQTYQHPENANHIVCVTRALRDLNAPEVQQEPVLELTPERCEAPWPFVAEWRVRLLPQGDVYPPRPLLTRGVYGRTPTVEWLQALHTKTGGYPLWLTLATARDDASAEALLDPEDGGFHFERMLTPEHFIIRNGVVTGPVVCPDFVFASPETFEHVLERLRDFAEVFHAIHTDRRRG